MGTPFRDYVINVLGTPYNWWNMQEFDGVLSLANDGDGFDEVLARGSGDDTWSYRVPGLTQDDDDKCIRLDAAIGLVQPFGDASLTWMSDENVGTLNFLFKGTSSGSENYLVGAHPGNAAAYVFTDATGRLFFQLTAGASGRYWQTTLAGYNDDELHMCTLTCDGVNPNRLYMDGALDTTSSTAQGGGAVANHDWINTARAAAGVFGLFVFNSERYAAGGFNKPWLGALDHVMTFNETLTDEQVLTLWNAARGIGPGGQGVRYRTRRAIQIAA